MSGNLVRWAAVALLSALVWSGPVRADTSAASYLVARQADRQNDYELAASKYLDALVFDPGNPALARGAVDALMALGDFQQAAQIAEGLIAQNEAYAASYMAVIADAALDQDYQRIIDLLSGVDLATNELTDQLVLGWAQLGAGDLGRGFDTLTAVARDDRYQAIGLTHLAMAQAWAGAPEAALETFAMGAKRNFQSPRTLYAEAQILAQLGRPAEALRKLKEGFAASAESQSLIARIKDGQPVRFTLIQTPTDGMAEIFHTLADVLNAGSRNLTNLYFAQMAAALRPDDSDARLLVADLFEQMGRTDLARAAYQQIKPTDPAIFKAAKGVAETLRTEGRPGEAATYLEGVIADVGPGPYVLVTLGDLYRALKRYQDAAKVYSERLKMGNQGGYQDWYVYYVRGIAFERLGQWPLAEADFRASIAAGPGQAQVLNYFGYSLVERGERLDEALAMIQQAVALRPDSGYIVDSLGWVYYRLGQYEQAVVPMELAVELLATDPIVNDHLGDVYWQVGRDYEARFQWQRALSFGPEPQDAERIRRKLTVGLDVVLREDAEAVDD